ncbi:MAG: B12-binding domain-containing radical SAM protein [Desulfobacteraceae bacterium]|nr:B12-binding domain-containing radical SAM protein [Desulfobacteraceae bacterium]
MKTLVLEHPRMLSEKRFNDIANTPLWSCLMGGYAASMLESKGFDTGFMDAAGKRWDFHRAEKEILDLDPGLLCVNAVYFWEHTPRLFDLFTRLRSKGFSGHINLFGFFPTLVFREILATAKEVDSIAVGEFEHTLAELAAALEKTGPPTHIPGLALNSALTPNAFQLRPPEKDPGIFPVPLRPSLDGTVSILGSRGCYNHCSFCPVPSFYNQGPLWRGRSPEAIAREMQALVDKGARDFYFADPNFIGPGKRGKERMLKLMDLIKPMKITFGMETRPSDLDDEILHHLMEAGFTSLLMGIESGSEQILGKINKSSGPSQGARAIELCRRHGIEPEVGFLMFVQDATLKDLRNNIDFLMANDLLDRLERTANLLCHCQIVLKGTGAYTEFERDGRLVKSGMFGFEGEVTFVDKGVKWMSTLVVAACHTILRSMGDPGSPVYFAKAETRVSRQANDYLADLFFRLLDRAERGKIDEDINASGTRIDQEIRAILDI